jgi:HEAT repeat protein
LERDNSIDRIGDKTIAKALTDSSSDVVALATRGVSNHQLVTALPQLGALLQHPLPAIRAAAARALESFDSKTSKQFIGALVKATTVETDPTAKKAITHAIYSISRQ